MSEEEKSLRTIFRGALLILVGFLGGGVMTLGLQIMVARFFQPDLYGVFSQGMSVLYVLVMLSLLGLNAGISRHISFHEINELEASKAVGSSLAVVVPVSIIVFSALFLTADSIANLVFNDQRMGDVLKIFSVAGPAMVVNSIFISGFRGRQRSSERVIFLDFLIPFLQIILVSGVILSGYEIGGAVAGYASAFILSMLVIGYWYFRNYCISYSRETLIELIRLSWPLMISAVSVQVFLWSPPILVGIFSASEETGLFNTALPLASSTKMFLSSVAFLYLPVVSELFGKQEFAEMSRVHSSATRWITYFSIPLLAFFIMHASSAIGFVFGKPYIEAGIALSVMALGYSFKALTGPLGELLIASGKTRVEMFANLSGLLIFVLLSIFLIPETGFLGAAVAYSIGMIIVESVRMIVALKEIGFFYSYSFTKPFISLVPGSVITLWLSFGFIQLLAVWAISYLVLMLLLKPLTKRDYVMIREILEESSLDSDIFEKFLLRLKV